MPVLHYIGIFQAIFLAILLLLKKQKNISHTLLALYFIVFGISIFFDFLECYNAKNNYPYTFLILITPPITMLHGPMLWFYVKSITTVNFRFRWIHLLHFLPFVLMFINLSIMIYFKPAEIKIELISDESFKSWVNYKAGVLIVTVFMFFYFVWCYKMIKDFGKNAPHIFSNIDVDSIKWMKVLFFSALILYSSFILINFLDLIFQFIPFYKFQFIAYTFGSLFILFLGFYGHQHSSIFTTKTKDFTIMHDLSLAKNNFAYNIYDDKTNEFVRQLIDFMNTEKPFLDPNLNLENLANQLQVSPYYLSDLLNNKLNIRFLDFINAYRIDEFKKLIHMPASKNIKIEALARDVGFNSKATFNRVFKKKMKQTPNEFKQQVLN